MNMNLVYVIHFNFDDNRYTSNWGASMGVSVFVLICNQQMPRYDLRHAILDCMELQGIENQHPFTSTVVLVKLHQTTISLVNKNM